MDGFFYRDIEVMAFLSSFSQNPSARPAVELVEKDLFFFRAGLILKKKEMKRRDHDVE